jgi:hypothetical protein
VGDFLSASMGLDWPCSKDRCAIWTLHAADFYR